LLEESRCAYNACMAEVVEARSGSVILKARLDFESGHWSTAGETPPEGEFPFVVHVGGKRYELYSDETFAEVEPDRDGAPQD
jgi:hypothetical protein